MKNKTDYIKSVRRFFPKGFTVYGITRTGRSGTRRYVTLLTANGRNDIRNITYMAAEILGEKVNDDGTITVRGCGFNAVHSLVYRLGEIVYKNGNALNYSTF